MILKNEKQGILIGSLIITIVVISAFLLIGWRGQKSEELAIYVSADREINGIFYVLGDKGRIIENISVADGIGQSQKNYSSEIIGFFASRDGLYVMPMSSFKLNRTIIYGGIKYYFIKISTVRLASILNSSLAVYYNGSIVADQLQGRDIQTNSANISLTVNITLSGMTLNYYDPIEQENDYTLLFLVSDKPIAISTENFTANGKYYYYWLVPSKKQNITLDISLPLEHNETYSLYVALTNNVDPRGIGSMLADDDTTVYLITQTFKIIIG